MAEEKKKWKWNRKKKPVRQEWKPHWALALLQKLWMLTFAVFKIALGAATTVGIICVICVLVFVGILGDYLQNDILPESKMVLEEYKMDENSFVYYVDSDGNIQLLQNVYAAASRRKAEYDEIPEDLIHAAVAIEDKRFYEHQGVDWITTIKACAKMFFGDGSMGGSTITQQLVKNVTHEDSVTVQRKVLEIFRATDVEKRYNKKTIMEYYLNTIYMGRGCYGVKTAAATYFGKELETLTTAECASLISITNNPSIFDPWDEEEFEYKGEVLNGFERNRIRKENTLWEMREQGWITDAEYKAAVNQELVLKDGISPEDRMGQCGVDGCDYRGLVGTFIKEDDNYYCPKCGALTEIKVDSSQRIYSWFVDTVLEDVARALAEQNGDEWNDTTKEFWMDHVGRSGYHIYTTLDMAVQEQVDKVYTDLNEIPETRSGQQLQSGIVVIDNRTGDIVAMSGGVGEKEYFDAFNRATDAMLQPGSSFKPLTVYAPGFESGAISPATVIRDLPYSYSGGAWPKNTPRGYQYSRTVLAGIMQSVNAIAVNVLDKIGTTYSYEFAKEKFGMSGLTDRYVTSSGEIWSDADFAPLAMGAPTVGVTVRDMASAYATFANHGTYRRGRTFTKVYDSKGNLVLDNVQQTRDILSEKTINYMNYCLQSAVTGGTGSAADFYTVDIAGKTGTTSSNKDRWFCGFTGYYTAAVWCGYDDPEEIKLVGNSTNPAIRLWKKVMEPIHRGKGNISLYSRNNFRTATVCLDSGKWATDACYLDVRELDGFSRTASAYIYSGDGPSGSCNKHVMVDYCMEGHGVANEYCKLFAEEGLTKIQRRALVKMTKDEMDEIKRAANYQLKGEFLRDDYIYLVNSSGGDAVFKGFHNNVNKNVDAPYLVCSVHTKEAWEEYQKSQQPTDPPVPDPTDPVAGGEPTAQSDTQPEG